ncbi:MAG: aspartyl/glutamyl-tRNA(Asn/Gln) amidotransferase, subunit [Pseudomonadota bacterium]|jgi:aspartyl/glutamyl-tRNA(Asn/Gln) amidotransferase C subunit
MRPVHHRPAVDRDWIQKISQLSRLSLTQVELDELVPQIQGILDHVDHLRSVPTDAIEPFFHPLMELLPDSPQLSLREDLCRSDEDQARSAEMIQGLAPEQVEGAFQVPQVITSSPSTAGTR